MEEIIICYAAQLEGATICHNWPELIEALQTPCKSFKIVDCHGDILLFLNEALLLNRKKDMPQQSTFAKRYGLRLRQLLIEA